MQYSAASAPLTLCRSIIVSSVIVSSVLMKPKDASHQTSRVMQVGDRLQEEGFSTQSTRPFAGLVL